MEAALDKHWLLGEPGWWSQVDESPPDFRKGELSPPETWISSTPRIGNFGWIRQRMRPLAWPLLRPIAWSPLFLAITFLPLSFPGRTPNDQLVASLFFSVSWGLVIFPVLFSRNSQPMSENSFFTLPIDWKMIIIATLIFPFHIFVDSRLGWLSYGAFWFAFIRTVNLIQQSMLTPPARFLLPMEPRDWKGGLGGSWREFSKSWIRGKIASASCEGGEIVLWGASRGGDDFLALTFVHSSGFIQDPFHETKSQSRDLATILSEPPPIIGMEWPSRFIRGLEEE